MIDRKSFKGLGLALALAAAASGARAADAPRPAVAISPVVKVPPGATLYYLSGALVPAGDTAAQTAAVLGRLKTVLDSQGLTWADVVNAHVFLAGDPAKGGEIDFAGLNAAWSTVFGTPEQPHKPSRTTVKVAALVAPGALVEIDMVAAKAP